MGIREWAEERDKKNLSLSLETKDFSNIGYWLRSLKYKFKKSKIYAIRISFEIIYNEMEDIE